MWYERLKLHERENVLYSVDCQTEDFEYNSSRSVCLEEQRVEFAQQGCVDQMSEREKPKSFLCS